jgi:hypothetical protein
VFCWRTKFCEEYFEKRNISDEAAAEVLCPEEATLLKK